MMGDPKGELQNEMLKFRLSDSEKKHRATLKGLITLHQRVRLDDITNLDEDRALRAAIKELKVNRKLLSDLWWFIENVTDETPDQTERFFALRGRMRS
jgi:hypothetical protein